MPRVNDIIRHIRIIEDGEQFIFGRDTFDSLIELIYYYKYHLIYHYTKLAHPINKEILEQKVRRLLYHFCHQFNVRFFMYSKNIQIEHRTCIFHPTLLMLPFLIFYRSDNSICHLRIFDKGGQFEIGNMIFDTRHD